MTIHSSPHLPFNTPLETGIRSVALLAAVYPRAYDLQRMVGLDHLIVHTGDVGGPKSLHPAVPFRSAELLVRRNLIERGLLLMLSRKLIERQASPSGIVYVGAELAEVFLDSLTSQYTKRLRERAEWVAQFFAAMDDGTFRETMRNFFDRWVEEFQSVHLGLSRDYQL